jgi:hypothetical protein
LLLLSPIRSGQHHFVPCQCIVLGRYPCLDISGQPTILLLSHTSSISTCCLLRVHTTFSPGRDYFLYRHHCRATRTTLHNQLQDLDWRRSFLSIYKHRLLQQEPWKSQHTHLIANTRSNRTLARTIANTTSLVVKLLTQSQFIPPWQANIKMSDAQVSVRHHNRALLLALPRRCRTT